MRELPILMSGPMVVAIREGRKTQTRRISDKPAYGVGDHLWVKETWRLSSHENGNDCPCYKADNLCLCGMPSGISVAEAKWKSGRFMFKKYARTWLLVRDVRRQRLQDISEEDARAEGFHNREEFAAYWDSLNAKRGYSWESSPAPWAYTFERLAAVEGR